MSKLPRISSKELIQALKKMGFEEMRQRGSHIVFAKETSEGKIGCVVPLHSDLALGTLQGILKQAKLTKEDLQKCL